MTWQFTGTTTLNDLPIRPAISWREKWHWGLSYPRFCKILFFFIPSIHFFGSNATDQMIWPSSVWSQKSAPGGSIGDPIWFPDCWVGHLYNLLSFGHVLFTPSFQNCLAHVVSQKNPTYPWNMFFIPQTMAARHFVGSGIRTMQGICCLWSPSVFRNSIPMMTWKTCDSKAIGPMYGICPYICHKIHQYHPNAGKYASWQFHESYGKWLKW